MPLSPELLGVLSCLISVLGTFIYVRSIFRGQSKPHVFTHLVWAIMAGIGFFAQVHDRAGPGAWTMGVTTLSCLLVAILALRYGEKTITRGDKISFVASLAAIIPWVMTDDPLGSVILISLIDIVAFYPTIRKSWNKPWEENLTAYNIANLKFLLSLTAITHASVTTMLYPVVVVALNGLFVIMCLIRRRAMAPEKNLDIT